jgi:hypothetical protein
VCGNKPIGDDVPKSAVKKAHAVEATVVGATARPSAMKSFEFMALQKPKKEYH